MLVDSKAVEKLVELRKKDKGLFNKVKQFIKDFFNKVVARYKKIQPTSAEAKLVQKIEGMAEKLQKLFEDALLDATESQSIAGAQKNTAQGGVRYHYAGPKATIKTSLFQEAIELDSNGVNSEEIRQKTGWFKGYDGMWRFEIDDSSFEFHFDGLSENPEYLHYKVLYSKFLNEEISDNEYKKMRSLAKSFEGIKIAPVPLSKMIVHEKLFGAYPQLKDVKFSFGNLGKNERGVYLPNENTIVISNKLIGNESQIKKTLAHEIQHAIQHIEGFASGASIDYWKRQRQDIVDTLSGARANLDLWLEDIGYADFVKSSMQDVVSKRKSLEQHWKDCQAFKDNSEYAKQIASCEAEIAEFQKQYDEITHGMTASEQYFNTAGEIEARDVSNRIDMTEEQRKNTRPDIDRTDVVFAGGAEKSNSIHFTAEGKPVVVVEDDILHGITKKQWVKTVKNVILQKFSNGIPISGRLIKVNKKTREEFTNSKYTKYLRDNDGFVYQDKLKSANNLDEIILASVNYINEDLNHQRNDNIKEFARGEVLIQVGDNQYKSNVIVGFTTSGNMVLYDVIDFTPANFTVKKESTPDGQRSIRSGALSNNSISNGTDFVNENYETPVTYDDSGNVIPLSERFDDSKTDIRFQKKVDSNAKLTDNKNIYNGGAVNGSQNTELLEQGYISAVSSSDDYVWKQSENSQRLSKILGVFDGTSQNLKRVKAGVSGWFGTYGEEQKPRGWRPDKSFLGRLSRLSVSPKDTADRIVPKILETKYQHTVLKNDKGCLLSLYHWTNAQFKVFGKGQLGYHLGTLAAAYNRSKGEQGYYKECYVNITNPLVINYDPMVWNVFATSHLLERQGVITSEEIKYLEKLPGYHKSGVDDKATIEFKKILSDKGYDGLIYSNWYEGEFSVLAFYPEQIYTVAENGTVVNNYEESETQNGLPRGVLNFQLKSYAVETDGELLAQHLEENSEAVGEILKRSANISMNYRTMRRLIEKRLREYGITSEDRKKASEYISVVFLAAEHPSVQGKDVTEDMTKAIREALESTPYDFNPNAEDYREVVDILKGFKGRVYLTADQEAHIREQGYDMRWLRQRLF